VTGVTLDKTTLSLVEGGSETLTATVAPEDASDKSVTWSSDNMDVATVADGVVTAVTPGTVTITVTTVDGGLTASCDVNVDALTVSVTGVTLDKTTLSLVEGGSETLTATVAPDDATNKNVTWSSDNTDVATVADGVVTAVAPGTATITVTTVDGSLTASCDVTVTDGEVPPTTHTWGAPGYTWSSDMRTVTASITCEDDPSLSKTETVSTTSSVTKQPTYESYGETTYVAAFADPQFSTQTRTVADIPPIPAPPTYTPSFINTDPHIPTPPPTPVTPITDPKLNWNIQAEPQGDSVLLTWNKYPNADGYVIYVKEPNGKYTEAGTADKSEFTVSGLKNNTKYEILIRARVSEELTKISRSGKVTATVYFKPAVTASASADDTVSLKWKKVPGAEKYSIFKVPDGKMRKIGDTKKTRIRVKGSAGDKFAVKAYADGEWTTVNKSDISTAE
ncbi:MAG: Ig-like domain-containing protein, partial [Ruminococcus sp.]|nr:Ig-like domain-containing protein [Ruminococcus sp.]